MKDTLQLHEIAGYLPYNVKMSRLNKDNKPVIVHMNNGNIMYPIERPDRCKVALRPMSDLIGQIGLPSAIEDYLRGKGVKRTIDLPHWAIQYLSGLNHDNSHYDWQDLIGRRLAVDINTLTVQP